MVIGHVTSLFASCFAGALVPVSAIVGGLMGGVVVVLVIVTVMVLAVILTRRKRRGVANSSHALSHTLHKTHSNAARSSAEAMDSARTGSNAFMAAYYRHTDEDASDITIATNASYATCITTDTNPAYECKDNWNADRCHQTGAEQLYAMPTEEASVTTDTNPAYSCKDCWNTDSCHQTGAEQVYAKVTEDDLMYEQVD